MAHNRRDYGTHLVGVDFPNRRVIFYPKRAKGGATVKRFGLGNAIINFNTGANLPVDGLVHPITDESSGNGIVPTAVYKLKKWHAVASLFTAPSVTIVGANDSKTLTFKQATENSSFKEVAPVTVVQNGFGSKSLHSLSRVEN